MKIKVCGMKNQGQVNAIDEITDFIGFIFYPNSSRYIENPPSSSGNRVGVFVNETTEVILQKVQDYQLNFIQLHGSETPEQCREVKQSIPVIKAFGIDQTFDFQQLNAYQDAVDYFLFDTKTPLHGGSGKQFDWSVLDHYQLEVPFLLSGGINPDSIEQLQRFSHPQCIGIDVNSGFEIAPGNKDINQLKTFIEHIQS